MSTTETNPVMTKFAAALAEMAVTGSNAAFVKLAKAEKLSLPGQGATKQANTTDVLNYLKSVDPRILYGLGGLGAGGLVGLLQGKNKKRNALWYGLLGGLGGLGLGTVMSTTGAGGAGGLPDADKPYDANKDGLLSDRERGLIPRDKIKDTSPANQEAMRNMSPAIEAHLGAGALGAGAAIGTGRLIDDAVPTDLTRRLTPDSTVGLRGSARFTDDGQAAVRRFQRALDEVHSGRAALPAGLTPAQRELFANRGRVRFTPARARALSDLMAGDALSFADPGYTDSMRRYTADMDEYTRSMAAHGRSAQEAARRGQEIPRPPRMPQQPVFAGGARIAPRDLRAATRASRLPGAAGLMARLAQAAAGVTTYAGAAQSLPDIGTIRRQFPDVYTGAADPPKQPADSGFPF